MVRTGDKRDAGCKSMFLKRKYLRMTGNSQAMKKGVDVTTVVHHFLDLFFIQFGWRHDKNYVKSTR